MYTIQSVSTRPSTTHAFVNTFSTRVIIYRHLCLLYTLGGGFEVSRSRRRCMGVLIFSYIESYLFYMCVGAGCFALPPSSPQEQTWLCIYVCTYGGWAFTQADARNILAHYCATRPRCQVAVGCILRDGQGVRLWKACYPFFFMCMVQRRALFWQWFSPSKGLRNMRGSVMRGSLAQELKPACVPSLGMVSVDTS